MGRQSDWDDELSKIPSSVAIIADAARQMLTKLHG